MRTIVFATNNDHKLKEVRSILIPVVRLIGLPELQYRHALEETADTLEENAMQKARFIRQKFGYDCFADDTGLEVEALGGQPGVYSARYAGEECDSFANVQKLLRNLSDATNRRARFRTVIALILDDEEHLFEGIVNGHIAPAMRGKGGFGYDPVFIPNRHSKTYAEMSESVKNTVSHRAQAVKKLTAFLAKTKAINA
ncbi:MAG: non-canonical purine NTP diphosphatase [Tannerella sp.]|jgi:XTP/dITP diphosphohydrolase|nr:non-canonical purine NTP diphosphatase [Tannerella sp.]